MTVNQLDADGINTDQKERVGHLIKSFRKEVYLFKFRLLTEEIRSDDATENQNQIYSLSLATARLFEYAFCSTDIRSLGSEVQNLMISVESWFDSLDQQSRAYVNPAVNSLREYVQMFLQVIALPKIKGQILSLPYSNTSLEELNLKHQKYRSVELFQSTKEDSKPDPLEIPRRNSDTPAPPIHKSLLEDKKWNLKYGGLNPLDKALLDELEERGYDTSSLNRGQVNQILSKGLVGDLDLFDDDPKSSDHIVERVSENLLEELEKKRRRLTDQD